MTRATYVIQEISEDPTKASGFVLSGPREGLYFSFALNRTSRKWSIFVGRTQEDATWGDVLVAQGFLTADRRATMTEDEIEKLLDQYLGAPRPGGGARRVESADKQEATITLTIQVKAPADLTGEEIRNQIKNALDLNPAGGKVDGDVEIVEVSSFQYFFSVRPGRREEGHVPAPGS